MQQQDNQRLENYHNYLYLWIEILISSIKNWHKFKNIVKLVDFLISYSFNAESRENSGHRFINPDLLDEFMTYVRSDFGIFSSETLSSYIADHQSSPANSLNDLDQLGTSSSNQSSWMQPPLSWISSSFYSVVNNTATQLSGTVGAAINAVNTTAISFASLSTGDFDSNQIQQFSYDKRLYKEFPYVGFYLSLCEERLECQLSIWNTYRSFLLGLNEFQQSNDSPNTNSQSFIDSCWRKTLHTVNKVHSLSLSFSSQRLMLFKWCERALELPHEHPLLILYWQKFFGIYLDKDYYSSLSNMSQEESNNGTTATFQMDISPQSPAPSHNSRSTGGTATTSIKSPTLKIFTSTSQLNSLLKQLKKQLELTSEYFAYRCHNNTNSPQGASAPVN